jgi:hypothetical protein
MANEPSERDILIVLADISGYTRFILDNQVEAVRCQLCISVLLEAVLREVRIPLQLQEIEGDAIFLYAAHDSDAVAWRETLKQVRKSWTSSSPRFARPCRPAPKRPVARAPCAPTPGNSA